jgi:DNA-binding CsgD family transcriptional regulator
MSKINIQPRNTQRSHGAAARRQHVAKLYLQGRSQKEIAGMVGVAIPTICTDLKKLHRRWMKSALMDFNKAKSRQLAKLDVMEAELWEAWQNSKTSAEITRTRSEASGRRTTADGKPLPDKTVVERVVRTCPGDSRYMEQIMAIVDMRFKLLGAYKNEQPGPTKVVLSWDSLLGQLRESPTPSSLPPDPFEAALADVHKRSEERQAASSQGSRVIDGATYSVSAPVHHQE